MQSYLSSIVGQKRAVDALNKFIISGNVPHALLFTGTRNVGQHFVAKQFLKELLRGKVPDKNFTSQIDKLEEPFIKYVFPLFKGKAELSEDLPIVKYNEEELAIFKNEFEKKINNPFYEVSFDSSINIKISTVRDIKKNLNYNYEDLPYRLILIEDAHKMSDEAQNALLKSLEEPPRGVIFILITENNNMLLPTIKSRCWEVPFSPLQDSELDTILENNFEVEYSIRKKIIPFAEGSIHKIYELLNLDFDNLLETSINILRNSIGRKYNVAIKLFASTIEANPKLLFTMVLQLIINWLNDVQKLKIGVKDIHCLGQEEAMEKFIKNFSSTRLDQVVCELTNLNKNIDYNINLNLIMLNVIFSLSAIAKR